MISVIVPVFNTGRFLTRAVEALIGQDYPADQYELLFVDNGSSDDSAAILQRYPEIRVLHEPVRGSYAARNRGLREARGEIIAFTDSDCFPDPAWLSSIEKGFDTPGALVLMGPRLPANERHSLRLIEAYENQKNEFICASDDPSVYFGYTNNMAVRRAAFDHAGEFVQRARGADSIFVQKVVNATSCDSVCWSPGMAVVHGELDSVAAYYDKVKTYSRSHRAFRHIMPVRTLTVKERMQIFRRTVSGYPAGDSAWLLSLLIGGQFAWWFGAFGENQHEQ
jgi:glycosyltransferase involved in cell wall biosynthesis